MSLEAKRFTGFKCGICGQSFDTMEAFKGHSDETGGQCIGGTPKA